jgi:ribosome-binding protein aMBF1 (putative translation factor)
MSSMVPEPTGARRPRLPESRPTMVKAVLPKAETAGDAGRAIQRAQELRGWSLKEFAAAAQRGERQLARWMDGTEHPQLDTLFAIVSFRQPLIQALAEIAGDGVEVETLVRIKRVA